jgi:hypothetical protein
VKGRVESGQLVTVEPIKDYALLEVGDIVLCKVGAAEYLHLIKSIIRPGEMFMIGNNRGHTNGQAGAGRIFGKCVRVED